MNSAIVIDIEGTVGSIAFVRSVLFPYAKRKLPDWVRQHAEQPEARHWLDQVARELGAPERTVSDDQVVAQLLEWIDSDRKHTALKALQGLMWRDGYLQNEYQSHIYPDAALALAQWHSTGYHLYVYSSGSIPAQKLFFSHSQSGNLLPLFSGFFDTEIGGKREVASYQRIATHITAELGNRPEPLLFLSDVIEELDAARSAQFQTVLVDRVEDYPAPRLDSHGHRRVVSFSELVL